MAVDPSEISVEQYNDRIKEWRSATGTKIRSSIKMHESAGKGKLLSSFRGKDFKIEGEIDRIAYYFERHGVFWHKGVGRGYVMSGGRVIRGRKPSAEVAAYARQKNRSVGHAILSGRIGRHAVEWFNPVVRDNITRLADMVAEMRADQVINYTKILIR